jgi:hypothetical protein
MDFSAPLGAFFIKILLSQNGKSVKTDKTRGLHRQFSRNSDDIGNIHEKLLSSGEI